MKMCFVPFEVDVCDPNANGMKMGDGMATVLELARGKESRNREGGICKSLGRVVLYLFFRVWERQDLGVDMGVALGVHQGRRREH